MDDQRATPAQIDGFLTRWEASGAAERANCQSFLSELCDLLGIARPDPSRADDSENGYVFERNVTFHNPDGSTNPGRIDLYKRGCFVLEAKQGSDRPGSSGRLALPKRKRRGTAVRGTAGWDEAMVKARGQAEQYARALPADEPMPAFLMIVDVGHVIELFADFTQSGRMFVPFPDALSHRINLRDLADGSIRERLVLVWTEPTALDPSRQSAKVTRDVAARLARLAQLLERSGHAPEHVAQFLMRCLFTFFAEDVGLLPKDSFTDLLRSLRGRASVFPDMVRSLWETMKTGGFSPVLRNSVHRFNGGLFEQADALVLGEDELALLIDAGERQWRDVEPAIFGTLLERALDERERHKLGAHYTPRAYVERLVMPTVIEPLREEWANVLAAAVTLQDEAKVEYERRAAGRKEKVDQVALKRRESTIGEARALVLGFLKKLCATTILDPACGTGNFLYVTMEHMKRLEGEVRDTLRGFGETERFEGFGLTIDPHQFKGIEINPRAAAIADLVLWIGYLQWHFRTFGQTIPAEPVLHAYKNIECRDALLDYDRKKPALDENQRPITRWDGRTMKKHAVTGKDVPDESAQVAQERYIKPRKAEWPKADYVVGNPPFLGQQRMRDRLGDGYVDAIREVHTDVGHTSDYVMYWWNKAAELLQSGGINKFGFVTTNKITQTMNQKIVKRFTEGVGRLGITFAIEDHPWTDDADSADVRIAMTSLSRDSYKGLHLSIASESHEDDSMPTVALVERSGHINADLSIGTDIFSSKELLSNNGLAIKGFELGSQGFLVEPSDAKCWIEEDSRYARFVRPYMNGDDLKDGKIRKYVIDFFGLSKEQARDYPKAFQQVLDGVMSDRAVNREERVAKEWWLFRRSGTKLRKALTGLDKFIGTTRTSKFRLFQFLPHDIVSESKIVVIADDSPAILGVLSSRIHLVFSLRIGGWLGVGNDPTYNHTDCFNKFAFPLMDVSGVSTISKLAESLDAHRKRQQALHPSLTLTEMYNVLEKLLSGAALTDKDRAIHKHGLISVLKQIHDDLDAAVFDAYGWPHDLTDEEILRRLVELNRERAAEEARGLVRWLRPEFQAPAGARPATQATFSTEPDPDTDSAESVPDPAKKSPWPKSLPEQVQAIRSALAAHPAGLTSVQVARLFLRARNQRVAELLDTIAALGQARDLGNGRYVRS